MVGMLGLGPGVGQVCRRPVLAASAAALHCTTSTSPRLALPMPPIATPQAEDEPLQVGALRIPPAAEASLERCWRQLGGRSLYRSFQQYQKLVEQASGAVWVRAQFGCHVGWTLALSCVRLCACRRAVVMPPSPCHVGWTLVLSFL